MMRQLIRTQNDLSTFVDSLKTLTLGQLAETFNKTLKHPDAKATVDRAIGKKTSKTISDRQARDLAANLLGFENAHVMAAHYKQHANVPMFQPWNILLEYKMETSSFMVGIPVGKRPDEMSKLELAAALNSDFNPFSGCEHLDVGDAFGEPLPLEEAQKFCDGILEREGVTLTRLCGIIGVGFDDAPDDLLDSLREAGMNGTEVDLNMGSIDDCSNDMNEQLLTNSSKAEIARVFLIEMEVPETMEGALEASGLSDDGRFDFTEGEHRAIVDLRRGYAGHFKNGELDSAFIFEGLS